MTETETETTIETLRIVIRNRTTGSVTCLKIRVGDGENPSDNFFWDYLEETLKNSSEETRRNLEVLDYPQDIFGHIHSVSEVTERVKTLRKLTDLLGAEVALAYARNEGSLEHASADEAEACFMGVYDSLRGFTDSMAENHLSCELGMAGRKRLNSTYVAYLYFDWESYARDFALENNVIDLPSGRVAIFSA